MTSSPSHSPQLRRNFLLMFWVSALLNIKLINMISTIFYVHRGLTLQEVFYTSIVWSLVNLLMELPSSYLADRWGRKKTILLSIALVVCSSITNYFAYNVWTVFLSIIFLAASFAGLSGTDEALIYDTGKQLGESSKSLKSLSKYYSGQRVFKIFTPLIATLIANNLNDFQFSILITLDLLGALSALILASRLIEPNHFMDLEKMEKSIFHDALNLLRQDREFIKAIFSRTMLFITAFLIWRVQQQYFVDLGISLVVIGLFWSITQLITFLGNQWGHSGQENISIARRINKYNLLLVVLCGLFSLSTYFLTIPLLLIGLNTIYQGVENIRWPLYSHFNNQKAHSFNRSITLSMTNFIKSLLDIPLLLLASVLVFYDVRLIFMMAFVIGLITYVMTRLKDTTDHSHTSKITP